MANATQIESMRASEVDEPRILWVGADSRGIELEVIGVVLPNLLLVIHCMPTAYRRRR